MLCNGCVDKKCHTPMLALLPTSRLADPLEGCVRRQSQVAVALPGLLHCDDVNLGGCSQVNQLVHLLGGEPLRVPAHACQRGLRAGGAPVLALPPGAAAGAWLVWRRCLVSALPHWLRCVWAWLLSSQHREGVLVLKVIDGCRGRAQAGVQLQHAVPVMALA